jgi:hypothetical protein
MGQRRSILAARGAGLSGWRAPWRGVRRAGDVSLRLVGVKRNERTKADAGESDCGTHDVSQ